MTANNKLHRRKHRRARQLAHIAAQTKPLPSSSQDSANFFRPISTEESQRDKQQHQFLQQQQPPPSHHIQIQQTLSGDPETAHLGRDEMIMEQQQISQQHLNMEMINRQQQQQIHQHTNHLPGNHVYYIGLFLNFSFFLIPTIIINNNNIEKIKF